MAGVIFESKSGSGAALAKVVVDATGDGDIFAWAGAEFEHSNQGSACRSAWPGSMCRAGRQTAPSGTSGMLTSGSACARRSAGRARSISSISRRNRIWPGATTCTASRMALDVRALSHIDTDAPEDPSGRRADSCGAARLRKMSGWWRSRVRLAAAHAAARRHLPADGGGGVAVRLSARRRRLAGATTIAAGGGV